MTLLEPATAALACLLLASVAIVAFRTGYSFGHRQGFGAGVKRGLRFTHLKASETDNDYFPN